MDSIPTAFEVIRNVTLGKPKNGKIFKSVIKLDNKGYLNHYFHFMEIFLGCFCWGEGKINCLICDPRILNKPLLSSLVQAVLPNVLVNPKNFSTEIFVIGNRDMYPKDSLKKRINKILDTSVIQCKHYFPLFLNNVYTNLGIKPKNKPKFVNSINVTYILRDNPKNNRYLTNKTDLFHKIRKMGVKLQIVKLEELSFKNQVHLIANTDILIGVHGNGLTNLLWLPKHASVFELFGDKFHHYDYQIFSEIASLNYKGFSKELFKNGDRLGSAYGHTRRPIKIDTDLFIKEFSITMKSTV